jgi:radical SAM protein with 4Fe4S-binding SPASM domain
MAQFFEAHKFSIQYSFDGIQDAAWRRCYPDGEKAYETARANIINAKSAVHRLPARMTVTRDRLNLKENAQHLINLGFDAVVMVPRIEDPWNKTTDPDNLRAAFKELADWYIETARGGTILPLNVTNVYIHRYQASIKGASRPENPCGIGRGLLSVDTEGNLMPCHHWQNMPQWWVGDISSGIRQNVKDSFEHFTTARFRGCETCPATMVCTGPCMALCEQFGGDMTRPLFGHCLFTQAHCDAAKYIYHTLLIENNQPFARFLRLCKDFLNKLDLNPNRTEKE